VSGQLPAPPGPPLYRKASSSAPKGYFAWEATGLRWLAEAQADGGVPVVAVLDVADDHLDLARLTPAQPTRAAAERFGEQLARTHAAGAAAYGAPPDGWSGDGFFGPLSQPLPLSLVPQPTWPEHLRDNLVAPVLRACRDRHALDSPDCATVERAASRAVELDPGEPPARIHGDLWAGNVLWTAAGATLIDPAAHGGHREADLAMLALFGAPHLEASIAAYQAHSPLAAGWHQRVGLHQIYPLAVHALLFGGSYAAQTVAVARSYR